MNRAACYEVSKHHANLWDEFASESTAVAPLAAQGDTRAAGFSEQFMPEAFHRFYASAPRAVPADKREKSAAVRGKLHDLMSELPEVETLRKQTVRNPLWAGMAAVSMAESLVAKLPAKAPKTDADKATRVLQGLRQVAKASPGAAEALAEHIAEAEGTALGAGAGTVDAADSLNESEIRQALRAGVEAAQQGIDEAEAALAAFGWGTGTGSESVAHSPEVAVQLARKVASSETLKKIVALAGRLTATARAKRATRSEYSRSEVVGVEQTDNFANLLPSEMVALGDPLRTAALFSRVLDKAAFGYKSRGKSKTAKGPIVAVLDQSGSMAEDDKDVWAKAITLALLDAARAEKRAFAIVLYNGGVIESRLFPHPAESDPRAILDMLSSRPAGGTSFSHGITKALDIIDTAGTFKRADVVHVTDGDGGLGMVEVVRARAEKIGAHIFGIGIGHEVGRSLAAWSDEVAQIRDVSADTKAVDLIFDHV